MIAGIINILRNKTELTVMVLMALLCLLAINNPTVQLKKSITSYMLLVDVSQSMNAEDLLVKDSPVTRIEYTKLLLKNIIDRSDCGSFFSINIFVADNIANIIEPVEKCKNYDELMDTISKLEWRMAWKGNSRITFGIKSAAKMQDSLNFPSKILFFTDGDEAPKVNAINRVNLDDFNLGEELIFVGIGGNVPVPVKRYNSRNMYVGYWGSDIYDSLPGATGSRNSDSGKDEPDPSVASADYERYLTKLYEDYLISLSEQIKSQYIKGELSDTFTKKILDNRPHQKIQSDFQLERPAVFIGLLLIVALHLRRKLTALLSSISNR
ncbi:MAG: VWA domain-containing protein [Nitrosomonadales bacterium]|nr:VWA domain-containing protein [Nitrosomonadales bacterium]